MKYLFNKMSTIDYKDIESIEKLAMAYMIWSEYNKGSEKIEVIESRKFDEIIVVHRLYDFVKVCDGWEFIKDVKYFLKEYAEMSHSDKAYLLAFWEKLYL